MQEAETTSHPLIKLQLLAREEKLQLRDFWKGNRVCINFDQFEEMAQEVGWYVLPAERRMMREQFPDQLITLKALHQKVPTWSRQPLNVADFIQQKATQIIKEMTSIKRPVSAPRHQKKPCATLHTQKSFLDNHEKAKFDERRRLKEYNDRLKRSELMMTKSILQNKNESEFELMLKIIQANEICTKLKNSQLFRISKTEGGPIEIIHVNERADKEQDRSKPLTKRKFLGMYEELKKKAINTASYNKQINLADLKQVLTETKYLSQQLQQQMEIMRSRGITSDAV